MRIVFHLGVHCTDDGRLIRSVLRSRSAFLDRPLHVPGPRSYRSLLRETLGILNGATASDEVQSLLLDALTDADEAERILLFHENLICLPQRIVSEQGLYAMAPRRLEAIANLFPGHQCEFHLALCNPAVLIPSLVQRGVAESYDAVMGGADLGRQRWLPTIRRIVEANRAIDLTLWCSEDAALIWPQILRRICALPPDMALDGDTDMAAALMSDAGAAALRDGLAADPPASAEAWTSRVSAALEEHGRDEELTLPVDLPGWTGEVVADLTEAYIDECAAIATMPGVRFLSPPG
ncbi:MAG: hypothetical protein JSR87_14940 [Proteobacteria bacterium]|nr:hypothetical protein [Pseudomonadota bacterium]MBS0572920.1 hypothetical protein [Pseudomonadota bacterium]